MMHALRTITLQSLGLALLCGVSAAISGCPRDTLLLGNDAKDAGGSADAGRPPTPTHDAAAAFDAGALADAGRLVDAGAISCGSRGQAACPKDQYCHFAIDAQCGASDAPGTCDTRPQICSDLFAPVCGCDGKTYPNACSAGAAGISVAATGACTGSTPVDDAGPSTGTSCGGLQGASCATGEYCDYAIDAQCGAADQTGVCTKVPSACTTGYSPVCGCDDKTYGNACNAASAGVSVASKGACPTSDAGAAVSCGGFPGHSCDKGQYCNYPAGAICGRADATGTCAMIPSSCTKELNRVCGCDGNTYNNPCLAAVAGTSVDTKGACGSTGSGATCGGLLGKTCVSGEYCNFPIATMCGSGDQTGSCDTVPQVCDALYEPVCGCDGKTYSNSCQAAVKSEAVKATGACK